MSRAYEDIIDKERPVSKKRPHMPQRDRAAQFAPFAALTGYDEAVDETAREVTESVDRNAYEERPAWHK